ncbi:MAG: peptidoglycan DD-metalloendopeptidase family protein [Gemmatimonadaceae bacterium]
MTVRHVVARHGARAAAFAVIALLAIAALRLTPPIARTPGDRLGLATPQAVPSAAQTVTGSPLEHADTLAQGETLLEVLGRSGLRGGAASEVLRAATMLDERRVPAGMPIVVIRAAADSAPTEVVFHIAIDHLGRVKSAGTGWAASEEHLPWAMDTILVTGAIATTLYAALDSAATTILPKQARDQLAWTLADVYEYRIDMSRDLQPGDGFRTLVERATGPGGVVRIAKVVAASFENGGTDIRAIRFRSARVSGDYFDAEGRSLRAAFLRAPLEFRRISSVFGMRKHPILGIWRQHKGTDYAAAAGTPVRAIGDGVVIFAGRKGGYGNVLEIRHPNGYVSRYGHLRAFAKGVRSGARVTIARTVAYVGATGLATAPHLHFEVLVRGAQRDPRVALRNKGGQPIPASERAAFDATRDKLVAALEQPAVATRLAQR